TEDPSAGFPSAVQLLVEREGRQHLAAARGDEHLLLELDALGAAFLTDIALDADRHVLLEHAVVAGAVEVLAMGGLGPFVAHADAVPDAGIAVRDIGVR